MPDGSFSKMSMDTSPWGTSTECAPTSKQLAFAVRSKSLERLMRASLISASDSSSLRWQTPTAKWGRSQDKADWRVTDFTPHFQGQCVWVGEMLWQTLVVSEGKWATTRSGKMFPKLEGQTAWLVASLDCPDLPKIESGAPLPEAIRTSSLRVNPRFGEALMGTPQRWTSLTECACRCWETL